MVANTMDAAAWLRKQLEEAHPDLLRAMVKEVEGAFAELDPQGAQLVSDPSLFAAYGPFAQIALAHLALEEVRFALAG